MNDLAPLRRDLLITLALLVLLLCWEAGAWDMALAQLYGNAAGFALRDHWLFRRVLHDGGRWLSAVALIGVAAWSLFGDAQQMARRQRWAWAAIVVLCLIVVPAMKRLSSTSCPWELDAFGGSVAYVPHWLLTLADGGPGHCFPSGHAVAAFAFLPLFFQWRRAQPRLAQALLAATLIAGAAFGWAQLVRGAHFPSHTMWSAWLCWTIGAIAARWLEPRQSVLISSAGPAAVVVPAVLPAR
jgi:membrane-associated PAP2 superfamily phosphatase